MTTPPDFTSMSPAELRTYAKDNNVDLSSIDSRRKAELVALLSAWHAGETYTPTPEYPDDTQAQVPPEYEDELVETYADTAIDDSVTSSDEFYESDEPTVDVVAAFDSGDKGVTAAPQSATGGRSTGRLSATVTEPSKSSTPSLASREQLEVTDLVGDDNRVRTVVNTFPAVVNGQDLCRLMITQVPGEPDTLAVVWWKNSSSGPVQQAPIARVVTRSTEPESGQHVVTVAGGKTVTYRRSKSCPTCGNRLANWRPWKPPVRVVQVAKR